MGLPVTLVLGLQRVILGRPEIMATPEVPVIPALAVALELVLLAGIPLPPVTPELALRAGIRV